MVVMPRAKADTLGTISDCYSVSDTALNSKQTQGEHHSHGKNIEAVNVYVAEC